jgi:hypothetical protein
MREHRITTGMRVRSWLSHEQRCVFDLNPSEPVQQESNKSEAPKIVVTDLKDALRQRERQVQDADGIVVVATKAMSGTAAEPGAQMQFSVDIEKILNAVVNASASSSRDIGDHGSQSH